MGWPIFLRPSIAHSYKYGIINPFPIDYASQPRLRDRLTLGRLALPRKPRVYGERVFHPFYRYLCQHNHFSAVHHTLTRQLLPDENAPLPIRIRGSRSFGTILSPEHFRRRIIRPVSYYAFFKRWLLLSQRPGCIYDFTTFATEHGLRGLSCWSGLLTNLRTRSLTPTVHHNAIQSLIRFGNLVGPLALSVLYLRQTIREAIPQYISGRTSYHRV